MDTEALQPVTAPLVAFADMRSSQSAPPPSAMCNFWKGEHARLHRWWLRCSRAPYHPAACWSRRLRSGELPPDLGQGGTQSRGEPGGVCQEPARPGRHDAQCARAALSVVAHPAGRALASRLTRELACRLQAERCARGAAGGRPAAASLPGGGRQAHQQASCPGVSLQQPVLPTGCMHQIKMSRSQGKVRRSRLSGCLPEAV